MAFKWTVTPNIPFPSGIPGDNFVEGTYIPSLLPGIDIDFSIKIEDEAAAPADPPPDPPPEPEVLRIVTGLSIPIITDWEGVTITATRAERIFNSVVSKSEIRLYSTATLPDSTGWRPTKATWRVVAKDLEYTLSVDNGSQGYSVGDKIVLEGKNIGGYSPYNDIEITVTSVSNENLDSILSFTYTGNPPNTDTLLVKGKPDNVFRDEIFKFVFSDKTEKILPPTNTEDWTAIIKWAKPSVDEKTINYDITISYLETETDAIVQTEPINIKQFIYWKFDPSLAKFQELVKKGKK
jgi:hypothetical protein